MPRLTLIGFGEAGETFARAAAWALETVAFDLAPARLAAARRHGLRVAPSATEALAGASIVLSLVTADQARAAADACVGHLAPNALYLDMNSVAPETKCASATAIEGTGGRYVDVAIMAPVHPAALTVPLFLSGPHAPHAASSLAAVGFTDARAIEGPVGTASAIKMIRSVMIKGIEALTAEMVAAAEAAGVTAHVFASLDASERPGGWAERAAYNLDRMETHGLRRAAEMVEVSKTLIGLGVEPVMTRGAVLWHRTIAERGKTGDQSRVA